MKKFRNFECSTCGKKQEDVRVEDGITMIDCECGKQATRTISAPRCFGNTTGKSPSRH